jgi:glycosyltransferase involved in cell wall biosynthesis
LIVVWVLSTALVILSLRPSAYDPVFGWFDIEPGAERRLIFVVVVGVLALFFLVLGIQSESDTNDRSLRLLVEALGRERFDWDRAATLPEGRRIVVVSPAYNEAHTVGDVVRAIPAELDGLQVIPVVVSDGSDDHTARRAREAGALVTELPIRRGGGLALRVGYEIALQLGAEIVVTMDADGQHLAAELPVMVRPILDGEADYVNGSRILGEFERESLIRHLGVHVFAKIVTVLTGFRITDPSSGYRAARAELLQRFVLEEDQFWTSEILIEALRHRARVVEVPVTIAARAGGETKKPASLRYGWNFSKVIVQTWLR